MNHITIGYEVNGKAFVSTIVACIVVLWLCGLSVLAEQSQSEAGARPWWEQEKIRFFWGQWGHLTNAGVPMNETMKNLSQVGATVFVDHGSTHLENARLAHKYGMRYFGAVKLSSLARVAQRLKPAPRLSVNQDGEPYAGGGFTFACPLYKPLYETWFLKPVLEGAKVGLVDGLHTDWEPYGGVGEAGICYCDDCFGEFMKRKGLDGDLPPVTQRYTWSEEHNLIEAYEETFQQRRAEMVREFVRRVHQVNPDFIFSGYNMYDSSLSQTLHTPEAPFFCLDHRHYYEDHTMPWWENHWAHYRKLGFVRIAGGFDNTLFGAQPESDVSVTQWMYDVAINSDGYWMWFEQELTPDSWRAFWIANERIRATEQKVGEFLLHGEQDIHFVTPVEWCGNPEFDRKIIQRTCHLGDEHLVHVNNVDTDRPMCIRLRLPRLPERSQWIVTDPIAGLTYVHDGHQAVWSARRLEKGIVVCLEKRSELFVKLSPSPTLLGTKSDGIIASAEIKSMPGHPQTETSPPQAGEPAGPERLVYTMTESLGYLGRQGGWAIGNAIHAIDANGGNHHRLYKVKGYLWSPVWSPDGSRIAFCHYANGRGQIYVMNADGSQVVNLSNNNYCDKCPVWSPRGREIAFLSDRDSDWEIYVMNADGSQQTRLTNSPGLDQAPAWSPDGQYIAFESDREGDLDIWMMKADGTGQRPVTSQSGLEQEPTWSPDGTHIACIGMYKFFRALLVVDTESGQVRNIMGQTPHLGSLCWSPDGQRIAGEFRGPQETEYAGIFVTDAHTPRGHLARGDDEHKLVDVPALRPYSSRSREYPSPTWYSLGGSSPRWVVKTLGSVCWSPDGTRLAFSSDMGEDGYFYIYTIPATGGEPTRLDNTRSAWLQQVTWCPR